MTRAQGKMLSFSGVGHLFPYAEQGRRIHEAIDRWFRSAPEPQIPLRVIVHSDGIVVHPERPVAFRGPIARTGLAFTIDGYARALLS